MKGQQIQEEVFSNINFREMQNKTTVDTTSH